MEPADLIAALERDGAAFVDACLVADPDIVIRSCPEFRPADLLWHLLEVHDFWRSVAELQAQDPHDVTPLERPVGATTLDLAERFREGLGTLVAVLRTADPTTSVWTWASQRDIAFIVRRMAQETAVHRWDAEDAAGRPASIDAVLASDGIDEFLTHMLRWTPDGGGSGGSVHLHCTDVAGEWMVRRDASGLVTTREHAKGDCALRGPAESLLLALWRRRGLDAIEVVGDAELAGRFVELTPLD